MQPKDDALPAHARQLEEAARGGDMDAADELIGRYMELYLSADRWPAMWGYLVAAAEAGYEGPMVRLAGVCLDDDLEEAERWIERLHEDGGPRHYPEMRARLLAEWAVRRKRAGLPDRAARRRFSKLAPKPFELVVQYRDASAVSSASFAQMMSSPHWTTMQRLQQRLDEALTDQGLGVVTGGDVGDGAVNVFVATCELAEGLSAIEAVLGEPPFLGLPFLVGDVSNADAATVAWPPAHAGRPFSVWGNANSA